MKGRTSRFTAKGTTMTEQLTVTDRPRRPATRRTSVTRSLLGYGVIAGPFYVVVSLAQALTRDGLRPDPARVEPARQRRPRLDPDHQLRASPALMTIACAVGLRRALGRGRATWAPRLVGVYGVSLIGAGIFRADPAHGLPGRHAGRARDGQLARHAALRRRRHRLRLPDRGLLRPRPAGSPPKARTGWAWFSRVTGVLFLAGFVAIAAGGGAAWAILAFVAAVVLVWAWLSAVASTSTGAPRRQTILTPPKSVTFEQTRRTTMRYLVLLKAAASPPPRRPPELMDAIMKLGEEATTAGALLDTGGPGPERAAAPGSRSPAAS